MLFSDPTLLVIEDATDHAALVRVAARRTYPGLDVRVAGDGDEGIAYLEGMPPFKDRSAHPFPELVILDLLMPGMDGFEVLKHIRSKAYLTALPVVVLTASTNPEHEEKALELGASAVYHKPDNLVELGSVVASIIEHWMKKHIVSGVLQRAR